MVQPLRPWKEFELSISEILGDNDFDFFYQFEMPLSKPDFNGRLKRIIDYVAVFRGLFLVIDSKAWKEMITPPATLFASGKVGYTVEAVNKLFWDACLFETKLLENWEPKCPNCGSSKVRGKVIYIKIPETVPTQSIYAFVDENGDPMVYVSFTCERCSDAADIKGYREPKFERTQILPTIVPIVVSKVPFKTAKGVKKHFSYLMPIGGFFAIIGEAGNKCIIPKRIFMTQIDAFDEFLKKLVESRKFPKVPTRSLEKMQDDFKHRPIDPNKVLFNYIKLKRKEHYWLSPGAEAPDRMREISDDMIEEVY